MKNILIISFFILMSSYCFAQNETNRGYKVNIGRDDGNSNEFSRARTPTSITVMEVSG